MLERYRPSGRVAPRFWGLLPACAVLAAALGLVYQRFLDANPLILLDPFAALSAGLLLGGISIALLRMGHVRNARAALAGAGLLTAAFFGAAWTAAVAGGEGGLLDRFLAHFENGDPIPGDPERRLPPAFLAMLWGMEFFVVLVGGAGLPLSWWRRAVYSERAGAFVPRRRIAVRFGPSPRAFHDAVEAAGWRALQALGLRERPNGPDEGEFRFWLHELPGEERAVLTVQWIGVLDGPGRRRIRREVLVVRRAFVEPDELRAAGLMPW